MCLLGQDQEMGVGPEQSAACVTDCTSSVVAMHLGKATV